jgi:hypothetical protein
MRMTCHRARIPIPALCALLSGARALSLPRACEAALPVAAAVYAAVFLACVAVRLTFGFELSWMESGMQAMVDRLAAGRSMYAEPSPAYVPFIYPPMYYVAAGAVGRALPALHGAVAMRLVSTLSTVATAAALLLFLRRRDQRLSPRLRLVLAGLVFAFYGRFHFWHDTSRVDSLFVLLLFGALALLIEGRGARSAVTAGLLAALATLTKQPAIPLVGACAVVVAVVTGDRRRLLLTGAVWGAALVALTAALGELRNAWFYYYLIELPAAHRWIAPHFGWGLMFVATTMPSFAFSSWRLLRRASPVATDSDRGAADEARAVADRAWAATFAASTAILLVLQMKDGANVNFFLPLVPTGIMVAGAAARRFGSRSYPLLFAQLAVLIYNPLAAIPTSSDWQAGFELREAVRGVAGDVFVPQLAGILAGSGKAPVAHRAAVCDLADARPDFISAIDAEIRAGRYAAAVFYADYGDFPLSCQLPSLARDFHPQQAAPAGGRLFAAGPHARHGRIYRFRVRGIE